MVLFSSALWRRLRGLCKLLDGRDSSVQSLSHVQLLATPWTAARQASLSITNSWNLLRLMFIESVLPSNHLILCHPFVFPSIFPASGSNELASFSLSISTSNECSGLISFRIDWFDLLVVQGDSQESSPKPQFESINYSAFSLLYGPTFISISDYWKNHSVDYMDLCWQSNISAS